MSTFTRYLIALVAMAAAVVSSEQLCAAAVLAVAHQLEYLWVRRRRRPCPRPRE